jgi:hypothetical protein
MIQQIIRCKTIFSKLSDYDIDDNATMLSIYFDEEDSTFEMDKFKKPPLNVNTIDMISKCGIYSLYGNYTTKLIGNVYECLSAAINLERFWVKMNTDNTDWINFEKLILIDIRLEGTHENLHNQIIFPSAKCVHFFAFVYTIDKEPELCIEYMKKSFTNKQKSRWDWLILHYNEDYYRMKMTDTDETIFKQMKMSKSNIA